MHRDEEPPMGSSSPSKPILIELKSIEGVPQTTKPQGNQSGELDESGLEPESSSEMSRIAIEPNGAAQIKAEDSANSEVFNETMKQRLRRIVIR